MADALAKSKVDRVYGDLRDDILAGRLKPGASVPTQREVSKRYAISEPTAWVAMARLMQEGLISRIRGKGSFVLKQKPKRREMIVDCVRICAAPGMVERESALTWIEEFGRTCAEQDIIARWHHLVPEEAARIEGLAKQLAKSRGVITLSDYGPELAGVLHRRGVPVVVIPKRPYKMPPAWYPQITFDRCAVGRKAADYLISLGYQRNAFMGATGSTTSMLNMRGFLDVLREKGLSAPTSWLREADRDDVSAIRAEVRTLLAAGPRPEAICCTTDHVALQVEAEILANGLDVPGDLGVIACATGSEAPGAPVPITTVGASVKEICERTIEVIVGTEPGFSGGDTKLVEPIYVPLHIIVRKSCAAGRGGEDTEGTAGGEPRASKEAAVKRDPEIHEGDR